MLTVTITGFDNIVAPPQWHKTTQILDVDAQKVVAICKKSRYHGFIAKPYGRVLWRF